MNSAILSTALAAISLVLLASPSAAQEVRRATPNVVLILTDDMGWADLGSYGAPDVKTPNIDALAKAGVRLDLRTSWKNDRPPEARGNATHLMRGDSATSARADQSERRDLANSRQDVARRLLGLLAAWERDVDAEAEGEGR